MSNSIPDRIDAYVATLNAIAPEGYSYTVERGKTYLKVVMNPRGGHGGSAHSFINPTTGALYKAAGWARPAKGIRFDFADDASWARLLAELVKPGAWTSKYLYAR